MAELPFGDNPFASKATPSTQANQSNTPPTTTTQAPRAPPPPPQRQKKRTVHIVNNEAHRGDASKRSKNSTADTLSTASLIMGDLAKDNFKDEDIVSWSKRGKAEAKFCFKQALGETFFHGLDLMNCLENENSKLQGSLTNAKASSDYYKGLLEGAERKIEELKENHKAEMKKLQDDLEKARGDAKSEVEALNRKISDLSLEKTNMQEGKDKELSDAFTLGFKAYLENFLAADPEYDWASHFAPSTPAYMAKFKVDNAAAIEKAKASLQAKITKELEAKAREEAEKGEKTQNEEPETTAASPSQTINE